MSIFLINFNITIIINIYLNVNKNIVWIGLKNILFNKYLY